MSPRLAAEVVAACLSTSTPPLLGLWFEVSSVTVPLEIRVVVVKTSCRRRRGSFESLLR